MNKRQIKKRGCCPRCLYNSGISSICRLSSGRYVSRFWWCFHCGYTANGEYLPYKRKAGESKAGDGKEGASSSLSLCGIWLGNKEPDNWQESTDV